MKKNPALAKSKRLLQDTLLLAFLHFRDGEHEESAKALQQASEISDVSDVVDEINEDHRAPPNEDGDEPAGANPAGKDSGGTAGGDLIQDEDDSDMADADEGAVQARLDQIVKKLTEARAADDSGKVRQYSRRIFKLHSRLRAVRASAPATPVTRQAAAMANLAKLKKKS